MHCYKTTNGFPIVVATERGMDFRQQNSQFRNLSPSGTQFMESGRSKKVEIEYWGAIQRRIILPDQHIPNYIHRGDDQPHASGCRQPCEAPMIVSPARIYKQAFSLPLKTQPPRARTIMYLLTIA
jgi:hypothetical protein